MRTFLARSDSRCALLGAALVAALGAAGCGGGSMASSGTGGAGSTSTSATGTGAHGSSSSTGSSTSNTSSSSSSSSGSTAIKCTGQPSTLSLSGTWAALAQLSVNLEGVPGGAITICPANQVGSANLVLLVTIQQDATDPTKLDQVKATLCSVTLPTTTALVGNCDPTSAALVTTQLIVPQAFLDALPTVAAATGTGTLGGTSPGATIALDALDVVAGFHQVGREPAELERHVLVVQPAEHRREQGVRHHVRERLRVDARRRHGWLPGRDHRGLRRDVGRRELGREVQRGHAADGGRLAAGSGVHRLRGEPERHRHGESSCEIAGNVATDIVYHLVGANVYLAGSPINVSSAIESLPTFQVDPSASKAVMVRVDGQYGAPNWMLDPTNPSAACTTVNMHINEL